MYNADDENLSAEELKPAKMLLPLYEKWWFARCNCDKECKLMHTSKIKKQERFTLSKWCKEHADIKTKEFIQIHFYR